MRGVRNCSLTLARVTLRVWTITIPTDRYKFRYQKVCAGCNESIHACTPWMSRFEPLLTCEMDIKGALKKYCRRAPCHGLPCTIISFYACTDGPHNKLATARLAVQFAIHNFTWQYKDNFLETSRRVYPQEDVKTNERELAPRYEAAFDQG